MKSLIEFLKESKDQNSSSSKTLSFNFSGLTDVEDFMKSLNDIADSADVPVDVDENKVKISLSASNIEDAEKLFELIQDFAQSKRSETKSSSDESYAQKISKIERTLNDWRDYVDDLNEDDDDDDDNDDNDDKKEEE